MRYYVEGSPDGPASFRTEDEAREYGVRAVERFDVRVALYTSVTHEPLRGRGKYGDATGAPFATIAPKDCCYGIHNFVAGRCTRCRLRLIQASKAVPA